jgi:arsenite methyltransferase
VRRRLLHDIVITKLRRAVSNQLSRPSGLGGRMVAVLMNRGNRSFNDRAIDLLGVQPGVRVLELGFGGGLTFQPLLQDGATVVGVDRASDMVDAATSRHRAAIDAGRLTLRVGDVQALPLEDRAVDRILTVNTVYFWPDLLTAFTELHRVLASDGRLVVGIRDGSVMRHVNPDVFTLRTPDELITALRAAGFVTADAHSAADGATHLIVATR